MHWEIIKQSEIELWNEKLKQTNATLFQYPYYLIGKYNSALYKRFFLKYVQDDKEYAFAAVIKFGAFPFKAAIIDDGPVILHTGCDLKVMLDTLISFLKKNFYVYLQIQPGCTEIDQLLKNNTKFKTEIYYPFHKKEEAEWNIYNQSEDKLLAGFKIQGRRKIILAGRVPYEFIKLETDTQLKEVEQLFKEVEKTKSRRYIPFSAMLTIYKHGKKHNLSEIYGAYLNNELVNAVLIIKDAQCYYHFTSAMVVKGYKYNESPPAKLHLFIMRDCFYNENKNYYNISFGGNNNLIRFKELFNPVEVKKPPYYSCILSKNLFPFFKKVMPSKPTVWKEYLNT